MSQSSSSRTSSGIITKRKIRREFKPKCKITKRGGSVISPNDMEFWLSAPDADTGLIEEALWGWYENHEGKGFSFPAMLNGLLAMRKAGREPDIDKLDAFQRSQGRKPIAA